MNSCIDSTSANTLEQEELVTLEKTGTNYPRDGNLTDCIVLIATEVRRINLVS